MKRLYKIYVPLLLFLGALSGYAQESQQTSFTLQQCIDYAVKNSVNMQNSILDEEIATSRVKETIGVGLPQINGSVNATSNPTLLNHLFLGLCG